MMLMLLFRKDWKILICMQKKKKKKEKKKSKIIQNKLQGRKKYIPHEFQVLYNPYSVAK